MKICKSDDPFSGSLTLCIWWATFDHPSRLFDGAKWEVLHWCLECLAEQSLDHADVWIVHLRLHRQSLSCALLAESHFCHLHAGLWKLVQLRGALVMFSPGGVFLLWFFEAYIERPRGWCYATLLGSFRPLVLSGLEGHKAFGRFNS